MLTVCWLHAPILLLQDVIQMIDDGINPDQFTKQKMDQYVAQSASDIGKVQTFETSVNTSPPFIIVRWGVTRRCVLGARDRLTKPGRHSEPVIKFTKSRKNTPKPPLFDILPF